MMQKAVSSVNDVVIVSVKGNGYRIHFWYMSNIIKYKKLLRNIKDV